LLRTAIIIGKGKVGEATAQTLTTKVDFHDPAKGITVNNFHNYDLAIVCVDTLRTSPKDHQAIKSVLDTLSHVKYTGIVAIRSTVSPEFIGYMEDTYDLNIVMFPEFMRQTDDLKMDTPWIVVLGGDIQHTKLVEEFLFTNNYYQDPALAHHVSAKEAAIIKLCQNAGLATKVIFYNMVNELCEKYNVDYNMVRIGVGADQRVGIQYSVVPSPDDGLKGFKGHCLPKDVGCLASIETHGFFTTILEINKQLGR
jgi:UDP-glucose 6-dehydrogenase